MIEQLSLFDLFTEPLQRAVSCFTGVVHYTIPVEHWMRSLVPGMEYAIQRGNHIFALQRTDVEEVNIPTGHQYYHYKVGEKIYSATGIGVIRKPEE